MNNLSRKESEKFKRERWSRFLKIILEYKATHGGNAPTVREIRHITGIASTSTVSSILRDMDKAGLIHFPARISRGIEVAGETYLPPPDWDIPD